MSHYLYFDHAGATTVRSQAWAAVKGLEEQSLGNPSSVHMAGRAARALVDQARIELAKNLLVAPEEVIFTSGATESLQLGIIGAYVEAAQVRTCISPDLKTAKPGVIYTSPLVHHCVWAALDWLRAQHQVEVKFLPLTKTGHIDLENFTDQMIGESDLVICEALNSEIGVLQPAAKLGKKMIAWGKESGQAKPVFVVDGAAAVVSELVGLDFQKCDLLALSGEKFGGLSGSGVLLRRKGVPLDPIQKGSQEWGFRGGSENLAGIAALNAAYTVHKADLDVQNKRWTDFGAQIRTCLESLKVKVLTPQEGSSRHILHFLLAEEEAGMFVTRADLAGLALSAGSACSSGSVEGSRVLQNMGFTEAEAKRGVRISWGWDTTQADVNELCNRLEAILVAPS